MNEFLADFARWTRYPTLSEWLPVFLDQPNVRELRPKLDAIVPATTKDRSSFVTQFENRVFVACYGAFISTLGPDWRSEAWARNQRFKRRAPSMVKTVIAFRDFLQDYPDQFMRLVYELERSLTPKYGNRADCTSLHDDRFMFDALTGVANALECIASWSSWVDRYNGPIDVGKPVRGKKVRSKEQLLAFHLEFLLRNGSIGVATRRGAMPGKASRPHRDVVASLVRATLGEQDADSPITAEWAGFSIKSILRDNPKVRIEDWPPGFGGDPFTWYEMKRRQFTRDAIQLTSELNNAPGA